MFSKTLLDRVPSTWRLAILQAITIGTSIALCLTLAGNALKEDLDTIARRVVLENLGEFALMYEKLGPAGLDHIFNAGHHGRGQSVRVVGAGGKIVWERQPADGETFPWPDALRLRKLADVTGLLAVEHPEGEPHVLVGRVVLQDGVVLWHGRSDSGDRTYLKHIRDYLWLAGVAAAIIALVPVFWYAGEVMQPVRSLIVSAQRLAQGAGESRLIVPGAVPELREFAGAFNTVLDRNGELTGELQAANDHLAHELRTPLARIRGNLEALHDASANPAALDATERGMDEIDRATHLVQTILNIRAGEHNALKLHREDTSLRELLGGIADLYANAAEDRHLLLRMEASEDITLSIDRQRIVQAVTNLLDNALACTPSGGEVVLRLETGGQGGTIRVLDTGPGLKADETEQVWQRFVRGSAASAKAPGMGLGLSLVRAVATAHGGTAGCANRDVGGAEFWIALPL